MSFNIRYGTASDGENSWEHRKELLLDTIAAYWPDLLGTQECLAFQADWLRERLPGYGFVGAGRDDGERGGEMCAVFFREDRFEKLAEGHFWLSETPGVTGSRSWDAALSRMATWVKLRAAADSTGALYLFNTHFDHQGVKARHESGRLLMRKVEEIAGASPAIVTGDFNAPADLAAAGPYRALVGDEAGPIPLADSWRAVHPGLADDEGTFSAFTGRRDGPRIDWILVSPRIEVLAAGIDRTQSGGRYPSDHFPVTATLRLPASRD